MVTKLDQLRRLRSLAADGAMKLLLASDIARTLGDEPSLLAYADAIRLDIGAYVADIDHRLTQYGATW